MSNIGLFQVFLSLYLLECVAWVPRGRELLLRGAWGPWRLRGHGLWLKALWPAGAVVTLEASAAPSIPPDAATVRAQALRLEALAGRLPLHHGLGLLLLAEFALLVFLWRLEPQPYRAEALLALMAAALVTHAGLVWALARSWRALGLPAEGRLPALLICALSPWASARGGDLLGRRLLAGVDPFAAAQACLPEAERRDLAAARLRRAAHPRAGEPAWDLGAWEAWCRDQGWDPAGLRARPRPDGGSVAWCPRCLQQYRRGGACSDCGLGLRGF